MSAKRKNKPLTAAQKERNAQRKIDRRIAQEHAELMAQPGMREEMERRSKARPGTTLIAHKNRRDHYINDQD